MKMTENILKIRERVDDGWSEEEALYEGGGSTNALLQHGNSYQSSVMAEPPDWETLMQEQGGFGPMQVLGFIACCLLQNQDGFLVYNLTYLLLFPKFECTYATGEPIPDGSKEYDDYC